MSHVVLSFKIKYNDQKLLDSLEEEAGIFVPFLVCKEGGGELNCVHWVIKKKKKKKKKVRKGVADQRAVYSF